MLMITLLKTLLIKHKSTLLGLAAVAILMLSAFGWHKYEVSKAVRAERAVLSAIHDLKLNELIDTYETALEEQREKSREAERDLLQTSIKELEKKDEKIKTLNNHLAVLTHRLQERNSRTDDSNNSGTAGTCTGAQLYREDGQFLAREAARADRILTERDFYFNAYETARKKLLELRAQSTTDK